MVTQALSSNFAYRRCLLVFCGFKGTGACGLFAAGMGASRVLLMDIDPPPAQLCATPAQSMEWDDKVAFRQFNWCAARNSVLIFMKCCLILTVENPASRDTDINDKEEEEEDQQNDVDIILCSDVLYNLTSHDKILRKLVAYMRSGAQVILAHKCRDLTYVRNDGNRPFSSPAWNAFVMQNLVVQQRKTFFLCNGSCYRWCAA